MIKKKNRMVRVWVGSYTDRKWRGYRAKAKAAGMTIGDWYEKACDLLAKKS